METVLIVLLLLMLGLAFAIGANDETMATLVGARALKFRTVILSAGVLVLIGVVWLGANVGKSIGAGLFQQAPGSTEENTTYLVTYDTAMMLAVLISTIIWLIIASKTGAPISTTHSVVGAVMGVMLIISWTTKYSFGQIINGGKMGQIAMGWVISPILGFMGAYLVQTIIQKLIKKYAKGLDQLENFEKKFIIFLIFAVGWTQISRGGNDAANAMGILIAMVENGAVSSSSKMLGVFLVGLMLALGLVTVGKGVIKNVGSNLIEMRPSDAFSIQIATSIVIFIATIASLPVSGSHILIFAVLGAGRVKGEKPDKKSFNKMAKSWVITFPAAAILAMLIYLPIMNIAF